MCYSILSVSHIVLLHDQDENEGIQRLNFTELEVLRRAMAEISNMMARHEKKTHDRAKLNINRKSKVLEDLENMERKIRAVKL